MADTLTEAAKRLLAQPYICNLATLMPDGSPHLTPVWVDHDGQYILVNTAEGRQKPKNARRDPRVALDIVNPNDPYDVLALRGRIVSLDHEGADAHIDKLAKKYLGKDTYPFRREGEQRVILRIEPERILAQPSD